MNTLGGTPDFFDPAKSTGSLDGSPFCSFTIDNMVADDFYRRLAEEWPDTEQLLSRSSTKAYTDSRGPEFERLLQTRPAWKQFADFVTSGPFVAFIQGKVNPYLWHGHSAVRNKKWLPSPWARNTCGMLSVLRPALVRSASLRRKFLHEVHVNLSFTAMAAGDEILPHNDAKGKLVSMIYYVPQQDWQSAYGGDTLFYQPRTVESRRKWEQIGASHNHLTDDLRRQFEDDMGVYKRMDYIPNRVIGFSRSTTSWHAVKTINCPHNMARRAFLITVYKKKPKPVS